VAVVVVVLPVNVAELSGRISHVVTTFMYAEPGVSDMTWMWGWRFDIAYKRVASATDDAQALGCGAHAVRNALGC